LKSSNSNKDQKAQPESLTLQIKKAETAVEVATDTLKKIRTSAER